MQNLRWFSRIALTTALLATLSSCDEPADAPTQNGAARREMGFAMWQAPRPLPALTFQDGDGRVRSLTDFRGKVIVLNIWATWCGPCREEMPTLDRLQAKLGGPNLEVLALSVDQGGPQPVRDFFKEIGIKHLRLYIDPSAQAMFTLNVLGIPTTLLIDRDGRELGRLVGVAKWDSPEMVEFLKGFMQRTEKVTCAGRNCTSTMNRRVDIDAVPPPLTLPLSGGGGVGSLRGTLNDA